MKSSIHINNRESNIKNALDIISLIVAIISLITTIYIGIQANEIARRSQPVIYSVASDNEISVFEFDEKMYSTNGIEFKQIDGFQSGELNSIFLSVVQDDVIDIVYISNETNEEFSYCASNNLLFLSSKDTKNKLIFTPNSLHDLDDPANRFKMFHLIFKGSNKEYTTYTVIYTTDGNLTPDTITDSNGKQYQVPVGKLKIYIVNENNLYDYSIYQEISDDLNDNDHYSAKSIFETTIRERKLSCERLKQSH